MPRSSGVYSKPAGTTAVANTTIESSKFNQVIDDLVVDANNPRPVTAGGTGATTAGAALTALGGQPLDATLTALAALGTVADRYIYTTGVDTFTEGTITAAGRALLDDADASAQRTTLGLGGLATQDILDDGTLSSESATRPPSERAVKSYVDAAGVSLTTSPAQTIGTSNGQNITWAHGLGGTPEAGRYGAYLEAKTANNGYAIGDRVPIHSGDETNRVWTIIADGTNLVAKRGITPVLPIKTGGDSGTFVVTTSQFDLYFWVRS